MKVKLKAHEGYSQYALCGNLPNLEDYRNIVQRMKETDSIQKFQPEKTSGRNSQKKNDIKKYHMTLTTIAEHPTEQNGGNSKNHN